MMSKKKENDYFQMFVEGVSFSCEAAKALHQGLLQYRPTTLSSEIDEMHKIEHAADVFKHEMMRHLLKEFITPIDREDIVTLANEIDNVTDSIEDVLFRLYMFNVSALRDDVVEFAALISNCCVHLRDIMEEFGNFRKSKTIRDKIIVLNQLEEQGDRLYLKAMHRLHSTSSDPVERLVWTEIYDQLEKCCDKCEDVAEAVEGVILKNS